MKILITGGSGFLGKRLIEELSIRPDAEIHTFSRSASPKSDGVQHHEGDIRSIEDVSRAVFKVSPDWIFHLAGDLRRVRDAKLHRELMGTNVKGALNMLSAASEIPIKAFISIGSFEEYGSIPVPFEEEGPLAPVSPYGASKAAASLLVTTYGKNVIPAAVVRFPVVYGNGQVQVQFMSSVRRALDTGEPFLMSPGDQTREFLHVDDAARSLISAAEHIDSVSGQVVNVCRSEEIRLLDLGQLIERVTGRSDLITFGATAHRKNEQMRYVGQNLKMKRLLGFEPTVSLEEGLRMLLCT